MTNIIAKTCFAGAVGALAGATTGVVTFAALNTTRNVNDYQNIDQPIYNSSGKVLEGLKEFNDQVKNNDKDARNEAAFAAAAAAAAAAAERHRYLLVKVPLVHLRRIQPLVIEN